MPMAAVTASETRHNSRAAFSNSGWALERAAAAAERCAGGFLVQPAFKIEVLVEGVDADMRRHCPDQNQENMQPVDGTGLQISCTDANCHAGGCQNQERQAHGAEQGFEGIHG